ncbi:outer membrane protein assembly factor BamB family protein [Streptomyces sp. NPDC054956]
MTEPPQPPNQPPTPSGYGHLPGPPQSGSGFPPQGENPYAQQPQPQQPQQQGPYGQQPPGGYGFPPPPNMPPTAPGMSPAQPAKPNKKLAVILAASVAGVLVLGAGGYFVLAGDGKGKDKVIGQDITPPPTDDKASPSASVDKGDGSGNGSGDKEDFNAGRKQGEDKVLWFKTSKIDGPGSGVDSKGQWIVGDTVVKTVWKSVTGYGIADGKEKWTLTLPAVICGVAGGQTADGKTVVMYKNGESDSATCDQMRMIDLKNGKEGWSHEVPKEGLFDIFTNPDLALAGDSLVVNRMGMTSVFKVSTGDKLFDNKRAEGCQPGDFVAMNNKMIAIATCQDADKTVQVMDADPVTGKSTWTYSLPKGVQVKSVYSLDPIVLDLGNEKKERSIVVLGPDGKQRTTVSGEGQFPVGCGGLFNRSLQGCGSSRVDANTLYLPTSPEAGKANEIVAFDLGSGKEKWRTPAGDGRTIVPLKAAGGQLFFYRKAEADKGGEVLTVPAAGGTPTAVLRNPSGPASAVESSFYTPVIDYVDGRMFLSADHLQAQNKDEKFLMVFGK